MADGWILWVWLQCIGVVGGCCKEIYRFPLLKKKEECQNVGFLLRLAQYYLSLLHLY